AQAQALAEEQSQRAEQQAKDARVRGRLLAALSLALVVALVVAVLAWGQRNQAKRLGLLSIEQALTTQVPAPSNSTDDESAILLAREAYNLNQQHRLGAATAADEALRRALGGPYSSTVLKGHHGDVNSVAFSQDGKTLA